MGKRSKFVREWADAGEITNWLRLVLLTILLIGVPFGILEYFFGG